MVDKLYVTSASIYCPLFRWIKILPILKVRITFVKCLQYVIDPALREPLPTTESLQR